MKKLQKGKITGKKEVNQKILLDYLEEQMAKGNTIFLNDVLFANRISRATFYNYTRNTQFRSENGKIYKADVSEILQDSIEAKLDKILAIVTPPKKSPPEIFEAFMLNIPKDQYANLADITKDMEELEALELINYINAQISKNRFSAIFAGINPNKIKRI